MPRIKPATSRPPLMQSSIAYSSAIRIGLFSGTRLPIIAIFTRFEIGRASCRERVQLFVDDGIVTEGNVSGIVDGGAAVVVTREKTAKERGLKPVGRIVSWAFVFSSRRRHTSS